MPDSPPADRVAARLAEIREGDRLATVFGHVRDPAHVPALLDALEAARKLADEWDEAAATADASAAAAAERGAAAFRTDQMAARAQARRVLAQSLREAIARELLREEAGDG